MDVAGKILLSFSSRLLFADFNNDWLAKEEADDER